MKHNKKHPDHPLHYQEKDPTKKKVCRFCGNNEYSEKYTTHLKKQHADLMEKREIIKWNVKRMNTEQLEQVRQFIIELKTK